MRPLVASTALALATLVALPAVAQEPAPAPSPPPVSAAPPAPAAKPMKDWEPVPTSSDKVLYALGVRGRGLFVPGFMLDPFLRSYSTMDSLNNVLLSGGVGLEFTRRKGTLDIVTSIDFSFYNPKDGNFLGKGKDATVDTHYTLFKGLNVLAIDVVFLWTQDLAKWIAIQLGGGIGIGIVFGDIFVVNNSNQACTEDKSGMTGNYRDPEKCHPVSNEEYTNNKNERVRIGTVKPSDPEFQKKLESTTPATNQCTSGQDCAGHPWYHKSGDKPPVIPMVNFLIGFKFKLHRHFNFNMHGGFRDGFVFGGGPEYVF